MTTELTPEVETIVDLIPYEEDDGDHHTHIVRPTDNPHLDDAADPNITGQDIVDMARLIGAEVTALCGYKFIPKHNPDKYPACQRCFDIAGLIMSGE